MHFKLLSERVYSSVHIEIKFVRADTAILGSVDMSLNYIAFEREEKTTLHELPLKNDPMKLGIRSGHTCALTCEVLISSEAEELELELKNVSTYSNATFVALYVVHI